MFETFRIPENPQEETQTTRNKLSKAIMVLTVSGSLLLHGCNGSSEPAPSRTETPQSDIPTEMVDVTPTEELPLICPQNDNDHEECSNRP